MKTIKIDGMNLKDYLIDRTKDYFKPMSALINMLKTLFKMKST